MFIVSRDVNRWALGMCGTCQLGLVCNASGYDWAWVSLGHVGRGWLAALLFAREILSFEGM
jgi:hypothetical protein